MKAGAGVAAALGAPSLFAQSNDIILKTIPSSGEKIPPVGIGTNRYGVQTAEDRVPLRDAMKRFVELGGKVMDTAAVYGNSEVVIGDIAAELGIRNDLFIVTKTAMFGNTDPDQGVQTAFERLKTDKIDGFLVHNFANQQAQLPVLRRYQEEGRIKYIGASTSQDNQHAQMEEFIRNNDVQLVQVNYSLGDRESANRVLPLAGDRGVAVMVNVPFGGSGGSSLFDRVEGQEVPAWAAEFGARTWGQFFLKYIISHPNITVASPGTRRVEHVEDNFAAATGRLPEASERTRMEQFFDGLT
jgi:aryl-alcohol dehydrogenase-like predicted oxidoreductase